MLLRFLYAGLRNDRKSEVPEKEDKMKKRNFSTERDHQKIRAKLKSQCDTFKHLSSDDSLKYNWARHYTDKQRIGHAREAAVSVNSLDETILLLLAESPRTGARTLEVLAYNPSVHVRQAVADNPATPKDTLLHLIQDSDPEVRYAMAENHNLPIDLLNMLLEDENPFVHVRAKETIETVGFNESR